MKFNQTHLLLEIGNTQTNRFSFFAWVNEWCEFKQKGYGYESHFICNQDGSCNGIQHYSGILKHTPSAKAVNLAHSERPQDVYTVVKDKVIENLKTMTDSEFAKLWLQFGVKRSTVKRAIMTSPYGSTRYSCSDFVDEDIVKEKTKVTFILLVVLHFKLVHFWQA